MSLCFEALQKFLQPVKFKLNSDIDLPLAHRYTTEGLKAVNYFFFKTFILDVWKGSEYASTLVTCF